MKDLQSGDDVQETLDNMPELGGGKTLKIKEGRTPVYLLGSAYSEGYVHWVNVSGNIMRIVCAGGEEGKGWAPEECALCSMVASIYNEAKNLQKKKGEDAPAVKQLRTKAGRMRAKYEAQFVAAVGELVREKRGDKKVYVPDFDDAQVGILSFTRQQYEDFVALRNSEQYSFMEGAEDLVNRAIVLDKRKRGGSTFATIEFRPAKHPSDPPDVEYDEDDFDTESSFELDEERIEKVMELLDEDGGEDDDVEFEEDDEKTEEEEVDDDFLDDDDAAEEEEEQLKAKKTTAKKKISSARKTTGLSKRR